MTTNSGLMQIQSNFAPVEEIGNVVQVTGSVNGRIPDDFPEGAYIRNGMFFRFSPRQKLEEKTSSACLSFLSWKSYMKFVSYAPDL